MIKFLIGVLLTGCASLPQQKLNPETEYRHDLKFKVNKVSTAEGHIVASSSDKYLIEIEAPGTIDALTLTSCHRHIFIEKNVDNKYSYQYVPAKNIEDIGSCPILLSALNKEGKNAFGFIELNNVANFTNANVKCNGLQTWYKGVSTCQTKVGLHLEISFDEKVNTVTNCPIDTKSGTVFKIKASRGKCLYLFKVENKDLWHRFTTIGYEDIILRK